MRLIFWMVVGLLALLAINIVFGLSRKLTGAGAFLPQPGPDEDQHIRDQDGRWWRKDPKTGVLEEAFKRPPGSPIITPFVWDAIYYQLRFMAYVFGAFIVLSAAFFATKLLLDAVMGE